MRVVMRIMKSVWNVGILIALYIIFKRIKSHEAGKESTCCSSGVPRPSASGH